jgi:hypothetical protein
MRHINDLAGRELTWSGANWLGNEYHLRAGGEAAAVVRLHGWLHARATARSGSDCWRFSHDGLLQTRVTIRACGDDKPVAVFRPSMWGIGGRLELADGRRYVARANGWMTSYEFATEDGTPLVRYRMSGMLRRSVTFDTESAVTAQPELSWLVTLGWYLNVRLYMDGC